jgi:hypothetical protein
MVPANAVRFILPAIGRGLGGFLLAVNARTFAKLRSDKFGRSAAEAGLDQGDRVKESCGEEACEEVVVPGGGFAPKAE